MLGKSKPNPRFMKCRQQKIEDRREQCRHENTRLYWPVHLEVGSMEMQFYYDDYIKRYNDH